MYRPERLQTSALAIGRAARALLSALLSALFAALCIALLLATPARAAGVPTGFVDAQIVTGLTSPTSMAVMPDGRVLVVQQNGIVRIIKNDAMLAANFHAFSNVDSTNERGCLGVVPDPASTCPGLAMREFGYSTRHETTGSPGPAKKR